MGGYVKFYVVNSEILSFYYSMYSTCEILKFLLLFKLC